MDPGEIYVENKKYIKFMEDLNCASHLMKSNVLMTNYRKSNGHYIKSINKI